MEKRPTIARNSPAVDKLTPRQQRALAALMACSSVKQAAQLAGVGERTIKTYRADPVFQAAYKAALDEQLADGLRRSRQSMGTALDTLEGVMKDKTAPPQARVSAAKAALDTALKLTEQLDLVEKLDELERWKEARNG